MSTPEASGGDRLLREGETCWRVERAGRIAVLIDGERFFGAVADALENAQNSVWLVGWDFHSAVKLRRDLMSGASTELVGLLDNLVRRRPSLHVRVLAWDFALLYALEREPLPLLHFGARTHHRIHFAMDAAHPVAASQHQKLVVVDDAVAFVGGLDLTAYRWDTRGHLPDDPRRVTPSGKPYQPFHDVEMAVDGDAALALGDLARERWLRATGETVPRTTDAQDPWPRKLEPLAKDVRVGIARTLPSYGGEPEVREIEALYRDSIARAERTIYVENQYLSSHRIGTWLAERLRDPAGPEIVIVGPRRNTGWLQEATVGVLRDRVVRELREADPGNRLRVLYPHVAGLSDEQILNVHSKVMVCDDTFLRIGSSNLSNRSLGVDTECDAAVEAKGDAGVRAGIAAVRDDLLAEHLGTSPERVATELRRSGSLIHTVDALSGGESRTLRPLDIEASDHQAEAVERIGAFDPEHPVPLEELVDHFMDAGESSAHGRTSTSLRVIVPLLVLAALAVAWHATPLGDQITAEPLTAALTVVRHPWYGPLVAGAVFTVACLLLVPVTALTVAAGLALGTGPGLAVAWTGSVAAAALGHLAGRLLWRDTVRRLAGQRLNDLSKRLARRGVLASAALRLVPIAPFMVVNLAAGASQVRGRDFVLGTALGMLPGTALLIIAADRTAALFDEPDGPAWLWAALAVLALLGLTVGARRLLAQRSQRSRSDD